MINKTTNRVNSFADYMGQMFMKVGLGILCTFIIAIMCVIILPMEVLKIINNPIMRLSFIIGEIIVIFFIYNKTRKLSLENLSTWFYAFTLLNGLGLVYLFFAFQLEEIFFAAFSAGIFFICMGSYGYFTKQDISHWGSIIKATLTGLFVISILQFIMFLITGYSSTFMSFFVSVGTIIILSLSTAFEMQTYKKFYLSQAGVKEKQALVTLGALNLYINYILMFKHILRILALMNNNKRD